MALSVPTTVRRAGPNTASFLVALLLAACSASGSAGSPASAATAGGWQGIVTAARAEKQVDVISQSGNDVSAGLTDAFQKLYPDIKVELTSGNGSDVSTKLLTERAAGRFTSDVVVHGTTTIVSSLLPAGALDPIAPALVGPDDQDGSKWLGGKYNFADAPAQYDVIFTGGVHMPLIYNPSLVSAGEIHSYRDLLNPKWKGKIAMYDPRGAGAGLSMMTLFYRSPTLGKDYITQLVGQDLSFTKDDRQLADWIARGTYAVGLAQQDFATLELKKKGVPIEYAPSLQEPTYLNAGWGSVALVNKAPHPNAARVYLDWLLSKSGQERIASVSGYPSRRLDTSHEGLADYSIPKPGVQYVDDASEENQQVKQEVLTYLKSVMPN